MEGYIKRLDGKICYLTLFRDDEAALRTYAKWLSNENTSAYIEKSNVVLTLEEMPGWVQAGDSIKFGIVDKDNDTYIGYAFIDHRYLAHAAWLSINIGESLARHKGIGTEVMHLLCKFCYDQLGVESIHLDVLDNNEPAINCYLKVGFKITGRYRKHYFLNGEYHDWFHMDMLREEYQGRAEIGAAPYPYSPIADTSALPGGTDVRGA